MRYSDKTFPRSFDGDRARTSNEDLRHCCGNVAPAGPAAIKTFPEYGSFDPFCRPAERGGKAASKTLVTDYRFEGPGYATHKLVGRGHPWTPPAPAGAAA